MTETAALASRIAHCSEQDNGTYLVHGVAIGPDEITNGQHGLKYWPADQLATAAETLEGTPLTANLEDLSIHGDDEPGRVTRAAWDPEWGVVYEAELDDETLAKRLSVGDLEVSIEARHAAAGTHEASGAMQVARPRFTALGVVERGAAQSNYTAPGAIETNPGIAALAASEVESVLDTDHSEGSDTGDAPDEDSADTDDAATDETPDEQADLNAYTTTSGVRFRGKRDGKLDESELPSDDYEPHYLFDGDTKSDSSYPVVDASGYLRRGNVAAAYAVGARGKATAGELHDKLRPLNDAFETPPVEPEKLDAAAAAAGGDDEAQPDDEPAEAATAATDDSQSPGADAASVSGATPAGDAPATDDAVSPERGPAEDADADADADADPDTTDDTQTSDTQPMSDDTPDDPEQPDDPSVATLKADLADVREAKSALQEDLTEVREERDELQSDVESLEADLADKEEHIDAAKQEYASALAAAGETLLDEDDLTEKFTLAELAAKYDDAEQAALAAAEEDLEPTVQSGGGEPETAELSDAEREQKQDLEARLAEFEDKEGPLADAEVERIEDELAELTEA